MHLSWTLWGGHITSRVTQTVPSTYIARALSKNRDNPVIMYHLGMTYYKLGRMAEAKEQLKKATEAKEDFPGKEEAKKTLGKM